jgi:hypothetical protein
LHAAIVKQMHGVIAARGRFESVHITRRFSKALPRTALAGNPDSLSIMCNLCILESYVYWRARYTGELCILES